MAFDSNLLIDFSDLDPGVWFEGAEVATSHSDLGEVVAAVELTHLVRRGLVEIRVPPFFPHDGIDGADARRLARMHELDVYDQVAEMLGWTTSERLDDDPGQQRLDVGEHEVDSDRAMVSGSAREQADVFVTRDRKLIRRADLGGMPLRCLATTALDAVIASVGMVGLPDLAPDLWATTRLLLHRAGEDFDGPTG